MLLPIVVAFGFDLSRLAMFSQVPIALLLRIGLPEAQIALLSIWVAWSNATLWRRIAGALGGWLYLGIWSYVYDLAVWTDYGLDLEVAKAAADGHVINLAVILALSGVLVLFRYWYGEVRYVPMADVLELPRFSIRQLLLSVTFIAIVLGLNRMTNGGESFDAWRILAENLFRFSTIAIIALAGVWASLGGRKVPIRLWLALALAVILGCIESMELDIEVAGVRWWFYLIGNSVFKMAVVIGSLLVIRSCGYRLVRGSQ